MVLHHTTRTTTLVCIIKLVPNKAEMCARVMGVVLKNQAHSSDLDTSINLLLETSVYSPLAEF